MTEMASASVPEKCIDRIVMDGDPPVSQAIKPGKEMAAKKDPKDESEPAT